MRPLAMSAALAIAAVAALPEARADVRVGVAIGAHDERGTWRDAGRAFRYGFDRGWRDGSESGHRDARRSRGPQLRRHDDFRDADNSYRGWMGSRRDFSAGYREGFAGGYKRAYVAARPSWRDRARPRWEVNRHPYPDFDRR